jgi:cytochrome c
LFAGLNYFHVIIFLIKKEKQMKSIVTALVVVGSLAVGSAYAVDMPKEGKAKCGACHAIEKKLVGPAWKDVAAKYAGKPDAEKTLIANITKGGAFGWKIGVMPARGLGATDAEIATLAKFIVELK